MEESLLHFPILVLNKFGYVTLQPTSISKILFLIGLLINFYNIMITIVQFYYVNYDLFSIVNNLEALMAFIMVESKVLFCAIYQQKLLNLVVLTKKFWTSDDCTEFTKRTVKSISSTVCKLQKGFVYMFSIVTHLVVLGSYFGNHMPVGIWIMDNKNLHLLTWITYSLFLEIWCYFLSGFEGLIIGMFYKVIIQFKILCDHLEQLNVENINTENDLKNFQEKLTSCIEHHTFLVRFIHELQNTFSIMFMIEYVAAVLACSEFHVIFESPNISLVILSGVKLFVCVVLLAIYFIPADYMCYEALTVSHAIYNSNWYSKHFISLKKSTQLMIQAGQQEVKITAFGGLVELNSITLITVFKTAFSISTILRSLKN